MKKPVKLEMCKAEDCVPYEFCGCTIDRHNKAISDYEAFLPDEEEVKGMALEICKSFKVIRYDEFSDVMAKAIAKRIGKG